MSVTIQEVERIAKLANLEFTPEEMQTFTAQFNEILAYVGQLNKVDTTGVEPLTHVNEAASTLRVDVAKPGIGTEEALKNAPDRTEEFFKVPRVIGGPK